MSPERLVMFYFVLGIVLSNCASATLLFWHGRARTKLTVCALLLGIWILGPWLLDGSHRIAQQALLGSAVMAAMFVVLGLPAYFLSLVITRANSRANSSSGL